MRFFRFAILRSPCPSPGREQHRLLAVVVVEAVRAAADHLVRPPPILVEVEEEIGDAGAHADGGDPRDLRARPRLAQHERKDDCQWTLHESSSARGGNPEVERKGQLQPLVLI